MARLSQAGQDAARRLRFSRLAKGFRQLAPFARLCGIPPTVAWNHENGRTIIDLDADRAYTRVLRLRPGTLLNGSPLRGGLSVPITGVVFGPTALVRAASDGQLTDVYIDASGLDAYIIEGNDLRPVFGAGDRVLFRPLREMTPAAIEAQDRYCVIKTKDRRQLVRMCGEEMPDGRRQVWTHTGNSELIVVTALSKIQFTVHN